MTHIFFNISCHKQSSAFSSHGKGLLDLKNIGDIWLHWNMAAFGHVSWFYDAVPFHPSLFDFLECKKKIFNRLFDAFRSFWDHLNYISFMHKSKNARQHASNISYYASYSIFIDIYSDFVPFHPALPYSWLYDAK